MEKKQQQWIKTTRNMVINLQQDLSKAASRPVMFGLGSNPLQFVALNLGVMHAYVQFISFRVGRSFVNAFGTPLNIFMLWLNETWWQPTIFCLYRIAYIWKANTEIQWSIAMHNLLVKNAFSFGEGLIYICISYLTLLWSNTSRHMLKSPCSLYFPLQLCK